MDCPAQSPDLNPTEHQWDKLEHRLLQTQTPHITNCSDYTSAERIGCHSAGDTQAPERKSTWQS
jgi:transposase